MLAEAYNTVHSDNDISAHPELKMARWAASELDPGTAAATTMYTSCQPCQMCTGAIARSVSAGSCTHCPPSSTTRSAVGSWPEVPLEDHPVRRGARPDRRLLHLTGLPPYWIGSVVGTGERRNALNGGPS